MIPIGPIQKSLLFHIPSEVLPQQLILIIDKLKSSLHCSLSLPSPIRPSRHRNRQRRGDSSRLYDAGMRIPELGFTERLQIRFLLLMYSTPVTLPPTFGEEFMVICKHRFLSLQQDDYLINHDGHHLPLLAVQVTELIDGIFLGCTVNHILCDGTSFWNFMRMWSDVVSGKLFFSDDQKRPLLIHNTSSPIKLPFQNLDTLIDKSESSVPDLQDKIFHFSPASIARLKKQVNSEIVSMDRETDNRKSKAPVISYPYLR
ncbi:hypothetical protein ZOSMA_109G00100 [Zostera marina]|uniref:Uncharacterized protein n=1 Tax=Zostera marina TaxID=29655 RepID=A0A0K9Q5U2_ZOSMR|nr:hypothetical protein ZOSMA_109G00100 [Zostera marina]